MRPLLLTLLGTGLALGLACSPPRAQLARAQSAFDAADLQSARMSLVDMQTNEGGLDAADRARYRYLRGMTALRLGDRAEARHWLGLAKANDAAALPTEWRARLDESLKELDTAVYDDGYGSLVTSEKK